MGAVEKFNQSTDLFRQADMLAKSGIVPKAFRGKPADVLAACLWGAEIGLGPMASMGYIDVIDGNPTLNTEGRMALVRRAGHSVLINADAKQATVKGKRKDTGDEQTVVFTIEMAARAGLANKQVWKQYPEAMLTSRALSQLCRNLFPDVMMGMSYAPEEAASFAAPQLLDEQPEQLAAQTEGRELTPPVLIDEATGEIVDAEVVTEPQTILAAGQRATAQRRRFAPPVRSQSAENTDRIMAQFADADVAKLRERVAKLDGFTLDDLRDEWKKAALPNITRADAKLTADEFKLAEQLIAKAEREAEVA